MDWIQIISQLGFPIACVLGCAWFILQEHKEQVKREERYQEQITNFASAMQAFNETLKSFDNRLENIEDVITK